MDASMHQLREIWLPPYEAQVKAGVYSFMAAHNELNGVPCHGNKWLLTDVLRTEWGFKGFVVSDWMDIERLCLTQKVAPSQKEAVEMSVDAGMDMHMHGPDFLEPLAELVKEKEVAETRVDDACRAILKAKFLVGLFEQPFADIEQSKTILFNDEHKQLALEAARKSIILLENKNHLLPLKNVRSILVTGPNANNHRLLGDWALPQPDENIITPFEGIRETFSDAKVDYFDSGESLKNPVDRSAEAAEKAKDYDAVVLVVGSNSLRYENSEKTCGENIDRANINLLGTQLKLVQAVHEANPNTIVVFVNGRPLSEPWIKENIPAVIEAWEPGAMGGRALGEILAGQVNPSGKLTMTFPHSVGQITTTYNHKPMHFFHKYKDEPCEPLWEFGRGLSYTNFVYQNLRVTNPEIAEGEAVKLSVEVENKGSVDGDEIVQLYIRDNFSSLTRPVKELADYKRVSLDAGGRKTVEFEIPYHRLGFYNREMKYVVEPGTFTLMVGGSSNDKALLTTGINVRKPSL
jgi:beta-glucosidase